MTIRTKIEIQMMMITLFASSFLHFACSMHGLVRGENMELGRDSDTGGQVVMPYTASV